MLLEPGANTRAWRRSANPGIVPRENSWMSGLLAGTLKRKSTEDVAVSWNGYNYRWADRNDDLQEIGMEFSKSTSTGELVTQVTRSFDFAVPQNQTLDQGIDKITAAVGVIRAEANSDRTKLKVTYDVREANAEAIQRSIEMAELSAPGSWWRRIRVAWLSSLDDNCRDNAAHRPACCSRPPRGAGKR